MLKVYLSLWTVSQGPVLYCSHDFQATQDPSILLLCHLLQKLLVQYGCSNSSHRVCIPAARKNTFRNLHTPLSLTIPSPEFGHMVMPSYRRKLGNVILVQEVCTQKTGH